MKFSTLFTILTLVLCLTACGDKESSSSTPAPAASSTTVAPTTSTNPTTITPPATQAPGTVNIPAGADGIVHHYICPDQCAGGNGAAAGSCPVCGKVMSHNQAFHNQGQAATASTTPTTAAPGQIISAPSTAGNGKPAIDVTNPAASQNLTIPPPSAEPAQNAQGVWHYTCANGCAGGAGSAVACATCGSTLAHNAVYHQ